VYLPVAEPFWLRQNRDRTLNALVASFGEIHEKIRASFCQGMSK
jgi:hypothetical protein